MKCFYSPYYTNVCFYFRKLTTFHEYVSGVKLAPVMTVFIGGNHEASNILQSLYYGGFVAPNIYFLGFAGVINYKGNNRYTYQICYSFTTLPSIEGLRIGGVSGIFNGNHYRHGHHEKPPYSESSMRSVYHLRELEVFRLAHLMNCRRGGSVMIND